jgi:hypothetical protein
MTVSPAEQVFEELLPYLGDPGCSDWWCNPVVEGQGHHYNRGVW